MPYVTTQSMLQEAREGRYAIPAFNVENLEMLKAVVEAAEEAKSPLILQAGVKTVDFFGSEALCAAVIRACEKSSVPIAFHLDHATGFDAAIYGFRLGFSSIMIDGSKLAYEDNIALTAGVCRVCATYGVPVEGELGSVGGKEDDHEADAAYTDPSQAEDYIARTGVSSLAVAIGTAHGVYAVAPKLDVERLSALRQAVSLPLVLHGSSGLSDEAVRACVERGICKVNFATELRQAYTEALRATLIEQPRQFDLRVYMKPAMAAVKALCLHRIGICGSAGRA